jgi:hypothetical protein
MRSSNSLCEVEERIGGSGRVDALEAIAL